jgi:hypothetical protein
VSLIGDALSPRDLQCAIREGTSRGVGSMLSRSPQVSDRPLQYGGATVKAQKFDVDIAQVGTLGNAFLDKVKQAPRARPIHWSEASRCWLITRHSDVDDALHGRLPLAQANRQHHLQAFQRRRAGKAVSNLMRYVPDWIIEQDPGAPAPASCWSRRSARR